MTSTFYDIGARVSENLARIGDGRFLTLYEPQTEGAWRRDIMTYRQFVGRAAAIGTGLRIGGTPSGGRVLLCLRHGWALHAAVAGCLLQGLVPVVFPQPSPKIRPEDYRAMVLRLAVQLGPDAVVADPDLGALLRGHAPAIRGIDDLLALAGGAGEAPALATAGDPARTVLV